MLVRNILETLYLLIIMDIIHMSLSDINAKYVLTHTHFAPELTNSMAFYFYPGGYFTNIFYGGHGYPFPGAGGKNHIK